jgi:hypothetical protein
MNIAIIHNNYKYREELIFKISIFMNMIEIKVANIPIFE